MTKDFNLAEKMRILCEWGSEHGLSVTAYGIAHGSGESTTNIQKILDGANANPGIATLQNIINYFATTTPDLDLSYFSKRSRRECESYLTGVEKANALSDIGDDDLLRQVAMRATANQINPDKVKALRDFLKSVDKK